MAELSQQSVPVVALSDTSPSSHVWWYIPVPSRVQACGCKDRCTLRELSCSYALMPTWQVTKTAASEHGREGQCQGSIQPGIFYHLFHSAYMHSYIHACTMVLSLYGQNMNSVQLPAMYSDSSLFKFWSSSWWINMYGIKHFLFIPYIVSLCIGVVTISFLQTGIATTH